jgi:hypothetical protein
MICVIETGVDHFQNCRALRVGHDKGTLVTCCMRWRIKHCFFKLNRKAMGDSREGAAESMEGEHIASGTADEAAAMDVEAPAVSLTLHLLPFRI